MDRGKKEEKKTGNNVTPKQNQKKKTSKAGICAPVLAERLKSSEEPELLIFVG